MSSFTFIHAADIHLDSPLRRLSKFGEEKAETLRTATRTAMRNLVDMAINESVDFVIIAGDLYDGDWDDVRTGLFMAQQMGRLRDHGIRAFIIHGNHDALTKMTYNVPFPDNVAVFSHRRPETFKLESLDVAIHGQSFAKQAVTDNLATTYPDAIPNMFNIGILHTSLDGREGHERYAPCTVSDLNAKRYQYWALGHVHTREIISTDPWIVFPGNPQGRSIRETGERGAMLVSVNDPGAGSPAVSVEFQPLDVARWLHVDVDASLAGSATALLDLVRERLARVRHDHDSKTLVIRLDIKGISEWSDAWLGEAKRWDFELRALLAANDNDLVIDRITFQTTSPATHVPGENADDPLAAIDKAVHELQGNPELMQAMAGDVAADLANRLPPELLVSDEPFSVMCPKFLASILDEVGPALRVRLKSREPNT